MVSLLVMLDAPVTLALFFVWETQSVADDAGVVWGARRATTHQLCACTDGLRSSELEASLARLMARSGICNGVTITASWASSPIDRRHWRCGHVQSTLRCATATRSQTVWLDRTAQPPQSTRGHTQDTAHRTRGAVAPAAAKTRLHALRQRRSDTQAAIESAPGEAVASSAPPVGDAGACDPPAAAGRWEVLD